MTSSWYTHTLKPKEKKKPRLKQVFLQQHQNAVKQPCFRVLYVPSFIFLSSSLRLWGLKLRTTNGWKKKWCYTVTQCSPAFTPRWLIRCAPLLLEGENELLTFRRTRGARPELSEGLDPLLRGRFEEPMKKLFGTFISRCQGLEFNLAFPLLVTFLWVFGFPSFNPGDIVGSSVLIFSSLSGSLSCLGHEEGLFRTPSGGVMRTVTVFVQTVNHPQLLYVQITLVTYFSLSFRSRLQSLPFLCIIYFNSLRWLKFLSLPPCFLLLFMSRVQGWSSFPKSLRSKRSYVSLTHTSWRNHTSSLIRQDENLYIFWSLLSSENLPAVISQQRLRSDTISISSSLPDICIMS